MEEKVFRVLTLDWHCLMDGEPAPNQPGVYQIYGDSLLYGRDALLYIGQAGSLASRLSQELQNSRMIRVNNKGVRIAPCERALLDVAESILIANHKPSMNAEYVHSPKSPEATEQLYLIQNHGDRGSLTLQVTNSYWVTPSADTHDPYMLLEPAWSRYAARLKHSSVVQAAIAANPGMQGRVIDAMARASSIDTVRDPDIQELLTAAAKELEAAESGA